MNFPRRSTCAVLAALACFATSPGRAGDTESANPASRPPGQFQVAAFELPFSNLASPEARALAARIAAEPPFRFGTDIALARAHYGRYNDARLAQMRERYRTHETRERWNGVDVDIVTPVEGIAPGNAKRVLVNIHGGAFMWGSGSGALVEAIPIAAVGRIKVVTIDYRLAPEHRFPAASEDVASVYRRLLESHEPQDIGFFGCSAGGVIVAQAVAWFQAKGLPRPGAIATMCGTGAAYGGDSVFWGPVSTGQPAPPAAASLDRRLPNPYMDAASMSDPLAFPEVSPEVLRAFPPTLLLAGSRDFASSILTTMHRKLAAQGVASELFLFDGLWHAFFVYPELPESREAYSIIAGFFDRRLGSTRAADQ